MQERILNGIEAVLFFSTVVFFIGWVFSDLSGWIWFTTAMTLVFVSEIND